MSARPLILYTRLKYWVNAFGKTMYVSGALPETGPSGT